MISKSCDINNFVLIKGYVYYEDMTPVVDAIVIMEELKTCKNENIGDHIVCTTTNKCGEFCIKVYDRDKFYKIKIFNNDIIKRTHVENVVIEMD